MKIKHLALISACLTSFGLRAQSPIAVDIKQFYAPSTGNYIEVISSIEPAFFQLNTKKDSGHYAQVQQLLILKAGEKIVDFRKKNIKSPYYTDSLILPFVTIERLTAPAGDYTLEYEISDLLDNTAKPMTAVFKVKLDNRENKKALSNIELVEKTSSTISNPQFAKSGYEIFPYVSTYYPDNFEKLAFYAEIYFDEKACANEERFVLTQYIANFEDNQKIEGYAKLSKINAKPVHPILNSFDIKNLPTGNYNLVLEIRNKSNDLVATESIFIQRLNQTKALSNEILNETTIEGTFVENINNLDSLNEFVGCIRPIASNSESDMANMQLINGSPLSKKQFIYLFWKSKDPTNPEGAWLKYKQEVKMVNMLFATRIKRGFETERGRIYLKYGKPNQITDRPNEPSAYPYQIWQYYKVGKFNNKFFLFYMPDLVSNDYEVLNSDIPGEYRNPRWEATLFSRNSANPNVDFNNNGTNHYGGNVNELLKNPR
jgi:GWxTD domain-containing protein